MTAYSWGVTPTRLFTLCMHVRWLLPCIATKACCSCLNRLGTRTRCTTNSLRPPTSGRNQPRCCRFQPCSLSWVARARLSLHRSVGCAASCRHRRCACSCTTRMTMAGHAQTCTRSPHRSVCGSAFHGWSSSPAPRTCWCLGTLPRSRNTSASTLIRPHAPLRPRTRDRHEGERRPQQDQLASASPALIWPGGQHACRQLSENMLSLSRRHAAGCQGRPIAPRRIVPPQIAPQRIEPERTKSHAGASTG